MSELPKYSLLEIERRWLVDLARVDLSAAPYREIEDLYVAGSRLRLRKISGAEEVTFKLAKKYGKRTPLAEPITNLYLTEGEYRLLSSLPGTRTRRRRYSLEGGSLDVYVAPHAEVAVFEIEFDDERAAREFVPPAFVTREITNEPALSGVSLASHENRVELTDGGPVHQ
jgi:CYTH domain-containing protein